MARMQAWQYALPPDALARGIPLHGDTTRLRTVLRRALRGEPLSIFAAGGSVTFGTGAIRPGERNYVSQFGDFMNATLPPSGGRAHRQCNGGFSAFTRRAGRRVSQGGAGVCVRACLGGALLSFGWPRQHAPPPPPSPHTLTRPPRTCTQRVLRNVCGWGGRCTCARAAACACACCRRCFPLPPTHTHARTHAMPLLAGALRS